MRANGASFEASLIHGLKGTGLKGLVAHIGCTGGALRFAGEHGGEFAVQARDVRRLRLARVNGQYGTFYEARLWRSDGSKPLLILPDVEEGGYAEVMRAFAAEITAIGGMSRIERGESPLNALLLLGLTGGSMGLLSLFLAAMAFLWQSAAFALAAGMATLATLFLTKRLLLQIWPRPIRQIADLDRELP